MAYTAPITFATGRLVTAADWNTYVGDNIAYLYANLPVLEYGVGDILNNSNVETTFATTTLTAGVLGTTGGLFCESYFLFAQASGGAINYTPRWKLGATTIFAPVHAVASSANPWAVRYSFQLGNMESASAQRCTLQMQYYTAAAASQTTVNASVMGTMWNTCAENSANALAFSVTCQMASATATGYIWHLGTRIWAPLN